MSMDEKLKLYIEKTMSTFTDDEDTSDYRRGFKSAFISQALTFGSTEYKSGYRDGLEMIEKELESLCKFKL